MSRRINAKMIVAYQKGEHRLLHDGCLVIEGNEISYVGPDYSGRVDEVIDAGDRVITPGFINSHVHMTASPLDKSFIEDVGSRQFYLSGLPVMLPARGGGMGESEKRACVDYSIAELIRTGTTTVMELGGIGDYVADAVEKAGLRAYIADMYNSSRWVVLDGKQVGYEPYEDGGIKSFNEAVKLVERIDGRAGDRIRGFISPCQIDNCSEELLRMSRQASDDLQVPLGLHTSQAVFEFQEMVRRHAMTPVEWLESIDFLSEWCILGHLIFRAGHSWVNFAGDDLAILARRQASVAHATWVFNRRGLALETFPEYLEAGVNVCLATDSCPQSMIEALRWTAVVGKILSRQTEKSTALDVFNAATLNAAKMLHRDDLGRISIGAKADLLLWSSESMFMVPLRDPIKNIVYNATSEDLEEVMIDGQWVMQNGRVLQADEEAVCGRLQEVAQRTWSAIGRGGGLSADDLSPQTLPPFRTEK